VEQITISSGDGQTPSDHNSTTKVLSRLNLSAPTMCTVLEVAGDGVPWWG